MPQLSQMFALGMPGGPEWIIIGAIALLIFGKRLPEVGRSLGKGIVEFKRGVKGIEQELNDASSEPAAAPPAIEAPASAGGDDLRVSRSDTPEPVEQAAPRPEANGAG